MNDMQMARLMVLLQCAIETPNLDDSEVLNALMGLKHILSKRRDAQERSSFVFNSGTREN